MAWMMDEFSRANSADVVNARVRYRQAPFQGRDRRPYRSPGRGVQFAIQSYLRDTRTQGLDGRRDLEGAGVIEAVI